MANWSTKALIKSWQHSYNKAHNEDDAITHVSDFNRLTLYQCLCGIRVRLNKRGTLVMYSKFDWPMIFCRACLTKIGNWIGDQGKNYDIKFYDGQRVIIIV